MATASTDDSTTATRDQRGRLADLPTEKTDRRAFEDKADKHILAREHTTHSTAAFEAVGIIGHDRIDDTVTIAGTSGGSAP